MCFESSKLHGIKKWQSTRWKIQTFLKQTFEVSIKTICRKWKREAPPKRFFIFKQPHKCQNKHYPENLNLIIFACVSPCMFPISLLKRKLWSYWKWQTFEWKIWPFFITSKIETYFPHNTFVSYIWNFFSRIYRDRIKNNFQNIWRI